MIEHPEKIQFACVPYLNALPLYVGLSELLPEANLQFLPPAEVAKAMRNGRAQVGLIPVFSLLESGMQNFVALSDIGICCKGEVLSVFLGAKGPIEDLQEVYLDPESRTSAALTRILAPIYLPTKIRYLATFPGYEKDIKFRRGGLIIGDRALQLRESIPHRLDLAKAWWDYTQLPFVFALWAIRKDYLSEQLMEKIHLAKQLGTQKIDHIVNQWSQVHNYPKVIAERYLKEHIYYSMGPSEHKGLKHFIHMAIAMEMVHPQREIQFYDTAAHYRPRFGGQENIAS
jgi:chorismate dehydratase